MDAIEAQYWFCRSMDEDKNSTPYEIKKFQMASDWMFAGDYRNSWGAKFNASKAIVTDSDTELDHYFMWIEENEKLPDWLYKLCNSLTCFFIRLLCLVSLFSGREGRGGKDDHIFSWGYKPSYAGWDAWFIAFDAKTFKYNIYTDGDWNM